MNPQESAFGPLIDSHSRAQAIEDGELIDISKLAKQAGFRHHIAVTSAVWNEYLEPPTGCDQSSEIRTMAMLRVLWIVSVMNGNRTELDFTVPFAMGNNQTERVSLRAYCRPGDAMEPVITIQLPGED